MAARKSKNKVTLEGNADPRAPLDSAQLLAALQPVLKTLEADLLGRARLSAAVDRALRARHESEVAQKRTADAYDGWLRNFVVQVAAAWVLSCVFVRTLEDRGLLGHARIAGPGALDSERQFSDLAPSLNERDYLLMVFRELTRFPATEALFDAQHNPVWLIAPSKETAKQLLEVFRSPNADAPALRFGQGDTRFLGDLYQDLSADVRERFALLQTPGFVEEFILERTLEAAIVEFGIEQTNVVDPTCGSGHFLLGAFARLVEHRRRALPGLDVRQQVVASLNAIAGVDINPYAIAIARFRLTLAALDTCGFARLDGAPSFPLNLVVGDSLLHRLGVGQVSFGDSESTDARRWKGDEYALVDEAAAKRILTARYAAVVGNPPYITVKDSVLRERYRDAYPKSAAGKYSLGAPFTERFFDLARDGGFVALITANSFMKREFGKPLVEHFLPTVDLQVVADTSTAHIPGHGTPTALLLGRRRQPTSAHIVMLSAKRAEMPVPEQHPELGLVWRTIAEHWSDPGYENEYVAVAAVPRERLAKHPWSLADSRTTELQQLLEARCEARLGDVAESIGFMAICGEDDAFIAPSDAFGRHRLPHRAFGIGEDVRDWAHNPSVDILFPYDEHWQASAEPGVMRWLWPLRSVLAARLMFGKTQVEAGLDWFVYRHVGRDKVRSALSIAFAFIATHNHFVLDRGETVFNRSAPIVKLRDEADEDEHLALLAYLNSSTACFWMKQVCFPKSAANARGDARELPERISYEFSGTPLLKLPLPRLDPQLTQLARAMELLVGQRRAVSPRAILDRYASEGATVLAAELVRGAQDDAARLRELKQVQDEIDAEIYRRFDLNNAQREAIEQPLYKRPWRGTQGQFHRGEWTYEERALQALTAQVARELEGSVKSLATSSSAREIVRSTMSTGTAAACVDVLRASGRCNDENEFLRSLLADDSVPFLATYRLVDSGLEKRREWERTWELQRQSDGTEALPVPTKYDEDDFREPRWFDHRGKLDVPKERFISYPGCESDEDKQPVYGWAGWNHLEQALALATLYQTRKTGEAWGKDRLAPMLAGILELLPWVKQWHTGASDEYGGETPGAYLEGFLDGECATLGLTRDDLRKWRPPQKTRARAVKAQDGGEPKPKKRAGKKTATEDEASE